MPVITIALAKGRILKQLMPLLERAGLVFEEDLRSSRKLIHPSLDGRVNAVVVRSKDVPTFVRLGTAQLGVVGKDVLLEEGGANLHELLDLNIGKCRMIVAQPKDTSNQQSSKRSTIRVATSYDNITRRHFAQKGVQANIIHLGGAIELAPLTGLAHQIVDLTETGNTLRANNLEEIEEIVSISSRLVANEIAVKTHHQYIEPLLTDFKNAVQQ